MILMRNHLNGGCVTVIEDTINDERKLSEKGDRIYVDDILNLKEPRKDSYDECNIDTECMRYDDDTAFNSMENESNEKVRSKK